MRRYFFHDWSVGSSNVGGVVKHFFQNSANFMNPFSNFFLNVLSETNSYNYQFLRTVRVLLSCCPSTVPDKTTVKTSF